MQSVDNIITTENVIETTPIVDYDDLEKTRKIIEGLDKSRQIDIAKIFKNKNIKLTENNNGIFINLNKIPLDIIDEIKHYINFVKIQETLINIDESKKENIENDFFKDKHIETSEGE